MLTQQPIGIFDSGIGGLSVANAVYRLLPHESLLYFADTGHVPYGPRPRAQIVAFSFAITQRLLDAGAKMIVVACNTATAAALDQLRAHWPEVPFVGMEPAVKPAAAATANGIVGILATQSTIQSERYAQLMQRYAADVTTWENPCLGLVPLIESGELSSSPRTRELLTNVLRPMLAEGIDTLVLGCTHYPFVKPLIKSICGPTVAIIDPAPAVARQVARRLTDLDLLAPESQVPTFTFTASGPYADLALVSTISWRSERIEPIS